MWNTFTTNSAIHFVNLILVFQGPCAEAGSMTSAWYQREQSVQSCLPETTIAGTAIDGGFHVVSVIGCGQKCAENARCSAFVTSPSRGLCYLLPNVTSLSTAQCTTPSGDGDPDWQTWSNVTNGSPCLNGGMQLANGSCHCYYGFVGAFCERLMEDCMEAMNSGYYPSLWGQKAILTAKPSASPHNITVICRINGLTIILRQNRKHSGGMNYTWQNYVDGFSAPESMNGAHWMGLKNLYYFTLSKRYLLTLYIRDTNNIIYQMRYHNFSITNDINFTASVGPFKADKSNLPDLQADINGQPFSSYDHNYGNNTYATCALERGGGWWYGGGCATSAYNLVGKFVEATNGSELIGKEYSYFGTQAKAGYMKYYTYSLESYDP